MRSLEECKAEVFRRSEERIKNRKKVIIKRSLISGIGAVACIMLTLCVIKWVTTVRLSDRPAGDIGLNDYDNEMMLPDGNDGDANAGGTEDMTLVGNLSFPTIEFEAQYTSSYNYREGFSYPAVRVIRSQEELQDFCENNKEQNISEACEKYDEAYFENQILIVVVLSAGSSGIEYTVDEILVGSKDCIIKVERFVPEIMTFDMREWHIFIEPKESYIVKNEDIINKEFIVEFVR